MLSAIKSLIRPVYRKWATNKDRRRLELRDRTKPCKVVIGSGHTHSEGWYDTDVEFLNLLEPADWQRFFQPNTIERMLAEHVWEHLTPDDGKRAAAACFTYLAPGGVLRIAVPDGMHPDKGYVERVRPGGSGEGADDHKVLYTYQTFGDLFRSVGFEIDPLEYHDEKGEFHAKEWDPTEGYIHRSIRFDPRNAGGKRVYTSIILDAKKPS